MITSGENQGGLGLIIKTIGIRGKIFLLALCICFSFIIIGCTRTDQHEIKNIIQNAINTPEVQTIRNMTFENTGVKLGDLFDSGLSSSTYELYDPAEDGNRYVIIKGNVEYSEKPIVVLLKYKEVEDAKFELYALEYNEVPQNNIQDVSFFKFLYEEYEKINLISEEKVDSNTTDPTSTPNQQEDNKADSTELVSYGNHRFGYQINYPEKWGVVEESGNGDGGALYSDEGEQIIVFGCYNIEDSFEEYLSAYYADWEFEECKVDGANQAVKAVFIGEESYQTAIIAEKDGTIYSLQHISIFIDSNYSEKLREEIQWGYDVAEASFKVY